MTNTRLDKGNYNLEQFFQNGNYNLEIFFQNVSMKLMKKHSKRPQLLV